MLTIPELKDALVIEKQKGSKRIKISWDGGYNIWDIDELIERIEGENRLKL